MKNYKITIKLLTETVFGSGHAVPGSVDLEIVYDKDGFPFMKAKTFKGNLREEMENAVKVLGKDNKLIRDLLGDENQGQEIWQNLKFSDCRLKENIREILKYGINSNEIKAFEIKEALTASRRFSSTESDGSARKGSLRQIRVIRRGLEFEVELNCERRLSEEELELLAFSVKSLKHIGTMRARGKGEIDCRLLILEGNEYNDKTDFYINRFVEEVKKLD